MIATIAEKFVEFGRESFFATGRAGERSGVCRMQQGCRLPQGIFEDGIVAKTAEAVLRRGQQECF